MNVYLICLLVSGSIGILIGIVTIIGIVKTGNASWGEPWNLILCAVAIFLLIVFAILALINRVECPNCDKVVVSQYCSNCGWDKSEAEIEYHCPECDKVVNSRFCPDCGVEVRK